MEPENESEELESKCKLGLDIGRYLPNGQFKRQTEHDAFMRFKLQHSAISPLNLLVEEKECFYTCGLYEQAPEGVKRKYCETCVLYSENKNGKKLGNLEDGIYHPQSLVMSNPLE